MPIKDYEVMSVAVHFQLLFTYTFLVDAFRVNTNIFMPHKVEMVMHVANEI